jgi:hypothetical protein
MSKKKRRKKTRSSKHSATRSVASQAGHVKRSKRSKAPKRQHAHATAEPHSVALLRAMSRRREALHGAHHEPERTRDTSHHAHKRARSHHKPAQRKPHHGEPVITEKSFENMLAFRRFQNHAR